MKTLYLECYSGISGDMTVAALLDLGADEQVLRHALASLPVKDFDIKISRVKKSGLDVCDFDVSLDEEHENHDHDMSYLHEMIIWNMCIHTRMVVENMFMSMKGMWIIIKNIIMSMEITTICTRTLIAV